MSVPLGRIVLTVLLVICSSCSEERVRNETGVSDRSIVPIDPAGVDSLRTSSGATVVLVNVWATWCAPCLEEMPGLVRLRRVFSPTDLDVIMVSTDDPEDEEALVGPALDSAGVDFRTYILAPGHDDEFIRSMNLKWTGALPATFMFRRGSASENWFIGGRTYEELHGAVSALLGE